jgi:hypothetical protein
MTAGLSQAQREAMDSGLELIATNLMQD